MKTEYRLVLKSGPQRGHIYTLGKSDLILGRDVSNDIVIQDPEVSRRHARLFQKGTTYMLEDLGSTNGTFVGGQRLTGPYLLESGETIGLGENCTLVYETIEVDTDATVVSIVVEKPAETPPMEPIIQPQSEIQPVQQGQPLPISQKPAGEPAVPIQPKPQPKTDHYVGAVPPAPVKKNKWWIWIVAIIALIIVGCIIVFVIIDLANLYCVLFPGIVNNFVPGYCR